LKPNILSHAKGFPLGGEKSVAHSALSAKAMDREACLPRETLLVFSHTSTVVLMPILHQLDAEDGRQAPGELIVCGQREEPGSL
jgi:hypothetical protein